MEIVSIQSCLKQNLSRTLFRYTKNIALTDSISYDGSSNEIFHPFM